MQTTYLKVNLERLFVSFVPNTIFAVQCLMFSCLNGGVGCLGKDGLGKGFAGTLKYCSCLAPAAYGVCKDTDIVDFERGRATALRLQVLGTRQVLLVSGTKLKEFMEANGVSSVLGNDGIKNYMKAMNVTTLEQLCKFTAVYHTTQGSVSLLLQPFDYLALELTGKTEDVLGLRFRCFLKHDFNSNKMEPLHEWFTAVKKPNAYLSNAVEVFAAESLA